MKKLKWFLGVVLLLLLILGIGHLVFNWSYSTGSRHGKLVKLSRRGVVFKEWEGTLDLGSGDLLTWEFSIHDRKLGKNLERHMGEQVTLNYKQHLFSWVYSTKYNVVNWRLLDINKGKICPFFYLLQKNRNLQEKVVEEVLAQRPDLRVEITECLERLTNFN